MGSNCDPSESSEIPSTFPTDACQLCGLITTQYRPEVGTSYPYSTYIVLLSQVFVSSVAGVYNQSLLKGDSASLHAQNTMLYAFGLVINGMIHTTIRIVKPGEPSLFAGYTNLASYLVILSNVFIGLAITAVYKCKYLSHSHRVYGDSD
jgi:hypothetical protein